ncbi:MAG: 3-isopropylmalate dehydratase large subunit [Candidatus Thermoplasmatota archaeon]
MGLTFAEKILSKFSDREKVETGQIVTVSPHHLLTHDNTAAIIQKIEDELDKYGVCRIDLPIIVLDHVIPAASEKTASNHKKIRGFVKEHGLKHFFDVGSGICHQIVLEKGLGRPGKLILGSDSHTCSYGAVGAFSSGIDRTEAASILLTGETWLKVPESIKISFLNSLSKGVYAKDLILHIIGDVSASGANYCSVEYHGETNQFSIDERFTIANMGVEMGAKNSVFFPDELTEKYFSKRNVSSDEYDPVYADEDAEYKDVFEYDLASIEPVLACPHTVDNVKPVTDLLGMEIQQCFLGTCTNGRLSDLRIAANILKGKSVDHNVRLIVAPASRDIYQQAIKEGVIDVLVDSGGVIVPPGCGACLGAHQGVLAPGDKCLSTANRNFKGRMGCKEAEIYLCSPATLAASAIKGEVCDPREEVK